MARGPKKHLKRIAAPKSWMLSKLGGIWATRPSQGPHKLRESIPLAVVLRHRLRYAIVAREVKQILNDKEGNIKVDGKVRRDHGFPTGVMDVISIDKTNEHYRVTYNVQGKFSLQSIKAEEAKFKLAKVIRKAIGTNKIPYLVTNDSRTIRYPHPDIDVHDTVKIELSTGKIVDYSKLEIGNLCYLTGGNNIGRAGVITHRQRDLGGFDIIHVKDQNGFDFATRLGNIFVIGKGKKPIITLPDDQGLYLSALDKKSKHDKQ